jgi:hypothetical protein
MDCLGRMALNPRAIIFEVTYFGKASLMAEKQTNAFISVVVMCIGLSLYPAARVDLLVVAYTSLYTLPLKGYQVLNDLLSSLISDTIFASVGVL